MKTKKIIADSMPLALKMVRQELGDNAIIVNTRTIKKGGMFGFFGKQKYEVTAYSIEKEQPSTQGNFAAGLKEKVEKNYLEKSTPQNEDVAEENQISGIYNKSKNLYHFYSQKPEDNQNVGQEVSKPVNDGAMPVKVPERYASNKAESNSQLLDEIQNMRKMMMNFMMGDKVSGTLPPDLAKWVNRLKKQGVDEEVIEHLLTGLMGKHENFNHLTDKEYKQELSTAIEKIIEKRIPTTHMVNEDTHLINVVGPTGVGKTTSIAKLATEQVLRQKRRVAMITTDVYRIGAVEQLKTYAGILNVPIEVVRSTNELDAALRKLDTYDLIYMDTTGRNYKEAKFREAINEYLNHPLKSENYLVMSMTTKFEDMQILLNEFLNSPIKKLILTKFDETGSYGSILNIAYQYPYQLAYLTNGQSVPEDIIPIDAGQITRYLLGEE
ncbi:flagellar biosynthesis protein FlhF [Neobacillus citreus]|uniref:Flagellar biosynthesis protein FlhF n=1 Tax=Neobacillus citreus TaxID=2833578 RepID=A0A942SUZ4_9BACI|nr:flagellar biosynthesis protein FlhF [Neobacillus citreus]MCH6266811.1 flagellar biosynthesis protein FlhF [Neobacillus citreus]